jgi:hypothetical protein
MGMEHHHGPRRRRVGDQDPAQRIQISVRLTDQGRRIIDALCQPGILHPDGCSQGDVIEIAIREAAQALDVPEQIEDIKRQVASLEADRLRLVDGLLPLAISHTT